MLTTITATLWFQKAKVAADAIWSVTCLFCVPGVMFASACLFLPVTSSGRYSWDMREAVKASTQEHESSDYRPSSSRGTSYRLGLFDSQGVLVHEYPSQLITEGRDAGRGSIVVEVPRDVPAGSYSLRVFKSEGMQVRDIPMHVGESK